MKRQAIILFILMIAFTFLVISPVQAGKSVTLVSYGGAWGKLIRQVFLDPFEKETGIKVNHQFMPKMSKVKAMVDSAMWSGILWKAGIR